jgi:ankyrin repeat protein
MALLNHGADPNAKNVHGNTPLFTAVFTAGKGGEIVVLLLEHGSDPNIPNTRGVSPFDLAHKIANTDLRKYFPDPHEQLPTSL